MSQLKKYSELTKQFGKYFGAALVGYAFDFGTLLLLHGIFSVNYLIAATVGFILGLVVLYLITNRYVFGESKIKSKRIEFTVFSLIGLVGLAILNSMMLILTGMLGINYIISKLISTVFVYAWNFFARRTLYHK